jgi:hypothetical protein
LRSCMMQTYKCPCLAALHKWHVMIMMNEMQMNRFTLLHKVGIQRFYKVVNIIQEHILQAHVIYCILFYYYYVKSTHLIKCFKDTPKQILLTSHALTRLIKP